MMVYALDLGQIIKRIVLQLTMNFLMARRNLKRLLIGKAERSIPGGLIFPV